jgi:hypothetical protein
VYQLTTGTSILRNEAAIQASMSAVFATGTFTAGDAAEFTAALAAGLLDDTYSLS